MRFAPASTVTNKTLQAQCLIIVEKGGESKRLRVRGPERLNSLIMLGSLGDGCRSIRAGNVAGRHRTAGEVDNVAQGQR